MRATEKRKSTTARHRTKAAAAAASKPKPKARPKLTVEQEKAYRDFEHAVSLVYKQEYDKARGELKPLAEKYPQDRELVDRVRIYLSVCEARTQKAPRGEAADPYLQALLQYNEGEYEEALKLLDKANRGNPNDARALYLTACAHLAHGEREDGLKLLQESIRIDASNRYRALNDPDLEEIRTAEDFVDAIGD